MEFIQMFTDNPWFDAIAAAIALASAIAAVTGTPKKGSKLALVYKIIDFLAINVGKAKHKGDDPKVEELNEDKK